MPPISRHIVLLGSFPELGSFNTPPVSPATYQEPLCLSRRCIYYNLFVGKKSTPSNRDRNRAILEPHQADRPTRRTLSGYRQVARRIRYKLDRTRKRFHKIHNSSSHFLLFHLVPRSSGFDTLRQGEAHQVRSSYPFPTLG